MDVKEMSFKERREQKMFEDESVWVHFPTRADLMEMTDEDLQGLGQFVVDLAKNTRDRQARGLA